MNPILKNFILGFKQAQATTAAVVKQAAKKSHFDNIFERNLSSVENQ